MRIAALAFLVASGCAASKPIVYTTMTLLPGRTFVGPREIYVNGDDRLVSAIEYHLRQQGFVVARPIPGVVGKVPTRYIINIEGECWVDTNPPDVPLHLELFDSATHERLFTSRVKDWRGCPKVFMSETVATIVRLWETPTAKPAPSSPMVSEF